MENKKLYERIIIRLIIIALAVFTLIYIVPFLYNALKPIFYAFLLALIINPIIKMIDNRIKIKRSIISTIILVIILLIILFFVFWLLQVFVNQILSLSRYFRNNRTYIEKNLNYILSEITNRIEFLPSIAKEILDSSFEAFLNFLKTLQNNIINITLNITSNILNTGSSFVIFMITFLLAFYRILVDMTNASLKFTNTISKGTFDLYLKLKTILYNSTRGYLKAQLLLALICTIYSAIGLMFLKVPYFLIIALIIGFVDLLPLLGSIAVYGPWGLIEIFIFNSDSKGIMLIALGFGFMLIRKLLEPKVIGSATGINPLLTISTMYFGYKVFNVFGAIISPIIVSFIVNVIKSGLLNNRFYDFKLFFYYIRDLLDLGKQNKKI